MEYHLHMLLPKGRLQNFPIEDIQQATSAYLVIFRCLILSREAGGSGKVEMVQPSDLVGFGRLASVGPVSVGPGAAEKSSLEIPE